MMRWFLNTSTLFLILANYILAIPEYGPVDLPDGIKLNINNRELDHPNTIVVSGDGDRNGGILSNIGNISKKLEKSISAVTSTGQTPYTSEDKLVAEKLSPNIDIMTKLLAQLGVTNPPSARRCTGLNETALHCIEEVLLQLREIFQTCNEVLFLNMRVLFGGAYANTALSRLNTISAQPQNRQYLVLMGTSAILYFYLMRENISDKTRWMAQSVLAKLTDLPVASNIAEMSTGGNGHINILLPSVKRVRSADRYMLPQMVHER